MKITFIATLQEYWGGSEDLWVNVAERAILKGHQVQVVVYGQKRGLHPHIENLKRDVSFVEMPNYLNASTYFDKVVIYLKEKLFPFSLKKVFHFQPDCIFINQVHSYSAPFHPALNEFLIMYQNPFFLVSHSNSDHEVLKYDDIIKARKILLKAKKIFYVSSRNKKVSEKQMAIQLLNADVIGNHCGLRKLKYISYPKQTDVINFASVARLEANFKGQNILLEVFSQEEWKGRRWHLNFYGTGPDEQYLKELTALYGLDKRVTFHGHVSNIEDVWTLSHALLMPSISEGKPLALQEAMICGRIAIVSDVAGNAELIDDAANGYIASSFFPKPFGEAMEKAWTERDLWEVKGQKAHNKIRNFIDMAPDSTILSIIEDQL